jgi:conjugal transfer pilus assembly protein TraU
MMKLKYLKYFLIICAFQSISYANVCTGRFLNPITDVCWDCFFPISIGAIETPPSTTFRPDTLNYPLPVCVCPNEKFGGIPTPGLALGMWEPFRMVDVTKRPFCLVSLGGVSLNPGMNIGTGSAPYGGTKRSSAGKWHVHWYINPLLVALGLVKDTALCNDVQGFDLAYMTEFDPLWNNDFLAFLMNPEAALFGNVVAQTACAADCVASSSWTPLDNLFWCSGCQGKMYPFTGTNSEHNTSIQSSSLSVQRFTAKLHRQLMLWNTSGPESICTPLPAPIIKKSQYRLQTTIPIPGIGPYGCNPFGRSTMFHSAGKEIPIVGEDFGYLMWRKKTCCAQ